MTKTESKRLRKMCERYAAQLGEELAARIEFDFGVTLPVVSERDRPTAQRYREAVRQLASC